MNHVLHTLLVEDNENDTLLILQELRRGGFDPVSERVDTADGMRASLARQPWDIIIADYSMPGFSGLQALSISKEAGGETPLILVSGTIGEEVAVAAMKAGVQDYIMKDNLSRLVPAVARELRESASRKARKHAEGWLRATDQKQRLVLSNIDEVIYTVRTNPENPMTGHVDFVSSRIEHILGYTPEEFSRDPSFWLDAIHPDDRPVVEQQTMNLLTRKIPGTRVYRFRHHTTREYRWVEDHIIPQLDDSGTVVGFFGVSRDITERREAEQTLQRQVGELKILHAIATAATESTNENELIESATQIIGKTLYRVNCGILLLEPESGAFRCHPSYQDFLNARPVYETIPAGKGFCGWVALTGRSRRVGDVTRDPYFMGTPKTRSELCVPLKIRDTVVGVINVESPENDAFSLADEQLLETCASQLSAALYRQRAQTELRKNEERYRTLAEAAHDMIFIVDDQDRIQYVNTSGAAQFNLPPRDVIGKPRALFFPGETGDRQQRSLRHVLATGESVFVETKTMFLQEERWLASWLVPLRTESGSITSVMGISRDITEHKRAEESLRLFRTLIDRSNDAIHVIDPPTLGFLDVNEKACLDLGYERDQLLNLTVRDIDPSMERSSFDQYLEHLRSAGYAIAERTYRRKDGSTFPVEVNLKHVVLDREYIVAVARDITDRKRAESLQSAIYRIAQAAETSPTLGQLYGAVHAIIKEVMPADNFYIALYESETGQLTFPYFVDQVDEPPTEGSTGKGLTAYVLRTGESLLCDEVLSEQLSRQGEAELVGMASPIWLGVPLIVGHTTIGAMVVQDYKDPKTYGEREKQILEYVSLETAKAIDRKRAEQRLRESESQFRLITENIVDLVGLLDLEGRYLYNSPSFRDVLGEPEELRGTDAFLEVHPDDRERIRQVFNEVVASGAGQRTEFRFFLRDGVVRFIDSQWSVIRNDDGAVTQVLVVSRDVTDKRRLEQQFLRAQRIESIGTLAGGIAHDLNNVLAPIMLAVSILKKSSPEKEKQAILETLETSTRRGSDIVRQVLTFARGIEGDRIVLQPKYLLDEIVKIIRETFPKSIQLRKDIAKNLWTLTGDSTQLHQVFLNLSINARDAMPNGGTLTLEAENIVMDAGYARNHIEARPGPYIMVTVSDTGSGILPQHIDKIFEPFFTTKEVGKGTGLGLSTARSIVKSHGGFVNVYSEPGKGSAFKVYLPAIEQNEALPTGSPSVALTEGKGETVLVIDDEKGICQITKETLETYGYHVLTASDGAEGIALYSENRDHIKVIITDMMMPFMDGARTILALKKINPDVKILAASGLISGGTSTAMDLGVDAVLQKPYTAEKLLTMLRQVLTN